MKSDHFDNILTVLTVIVCIGCAGLLAYAFQTISGASAPFPIEARNER